MSSLNNVPIYCENEEKIQTFFNSWLRLFSFHNSIKDGDFCLIV